MDELPELPADGVIAEDEQEIEATNVLDDDSNLTIEDIRGHVAAGSSIQSVEEDGTIVLAKALRSSSRAEDIDNEMHKEVQDERGKHGKRKRTANKLYNTDAFSRHYDDEGSDIGLYRKYTACER